MPDEPTVSFALQRARPIRGPGIPEAPRMVQEPPARQLRRQARKPPEPEPEKPTPPDPDMLPTRVANGDSPTTGGVTESSQLVPESQRPSEVAIPIGDVLALTKAPKALEVLQLFHAMDYTSGRLALHMIHKLWPELFGK